MGPTRRSIWWAIPSLPRPGVGHASRSSPKHGCLRPARSWRASARSEEKDAPSFLPLPSSTRAILEIGRSMKRRPPGPGGFLEELSQVWEAEQRRGGETAARRLVFRRSLVLVLVLVTVLEGVTLAALLPVYRSCFAGTLGPGGQWFSWIHINDAARLILHSLDQETITGPFISASPNPVTSREFAKIFAHTLHRPRLFPMSRGMMKLAWGESADIFFDHNRTVE